MNNELKREIRNREEFLAAVIKRNELTEIDLDAEAEKIQRKESRLSARKRKIIVEAVEFRRLTEEMTRIAEVTE